MRQTKSLSGGGAAQLPDMPQSAIDRAEERALPREVWDSPGFVHLINDDEPSRFEARTLEVVRDDVRLGDRPGLVVRIEPPVEHVPGGPLDQALLLARREGVDVDSLRRGAPSKPEHVFVCRLASKIGDDQDILEADDVSIVFWGLVTN
jgi:hypothetical protein